MGIGGLGDWGIWPSSIGPWGLQILLWCGGGASYQLTLRFAIRGVAEEEGIFSFPSFVQVDA